ncbi:MAG: flippase [Bacilli bacterium]
MKKDKITVNYLYNVAYQILTMLTPIITAPFLARTLGADSLGVHTYTYSIVYWFLLFGMMGVSLYGNKEIAKVSNDREKRSQKFSEIFTFQFLNMLISLVIFYIVFNIIHTEYKAAFMIQGLIILANAFDISWFYSGVENFKKITYRNFFVKIVTIILILVIIRNSSQTLVYIGISVFMNFVSTLIMWFNIKKYVDYKIPKLKDVYKHFKETFILFLPTIATTVYSIFDQTMIGLLYKDVSEVTFYSQAHKFVNMFLFITNTIGTVMLPRMVNTKTIDGDEKVKKYTHKTFQIALFLAFPIAFGIIGVAPYFIPWFLTEEFTRVGYLMQILAPIIIFISMTNVLGMQYLIVFDKYKQYTISVTIGCITNLILNFLLIKDLGAFGAAIASVITEFIVFVIQYFMVKDSFDFNGCLKKFFKYLSMSAAMLLVVLIIGHYMGVGVLTNIIQVVAGAGIYILLLVITKDDIFKFLLKKLKETFFKRKE